MNETMMHSIFRADVWLIVSVLAYFLLNGAQWYETLVIIPKWTSRPPASLAALQGPYAPDLKKFWMAAHSIHELTFILAIVLCWNQPGTRNILILIFVLHFIVRLWTIGYFAPAIFKFQKTDPNAPSGSINRRVRRWKNLNYLRVLVFTGLSIWLAIVCCQFCSG